MFFTRCKYKLSKALKLIPKPLSIITRLIYINLLTLTLFLSFNIISVITFSIVVFKNPVSMTKILLPLSIISSTYANMLTLSISFPHLKFTFIFLTILPFSMTFAIIRIISKISNIFKNDIFRLFIIFKIFYSLSIFFPLTIQTFMFITIRILHYSKYKFYKVKKLYPYPDS